MTITVKPVGNHSVERKIRSFKLWVSFAYNEKKLYRKPWYLMTSLERKESCWHTCSATSINCVEYYSFHQQKEEHKEPGCEETGWWEVCAKDLRKILLVFTYSFPSYLEWQFFCLMFVEEGQEALKIIHLKQQNVFNLPGMQLFTKN